MAFTNKYANFDLSTGANDGSSEANAWKTPAAVIAAVAAGNMVNIKRQASPYNQTGSLDFNVNGTATSPIYYRGYTSTIGDGGIWECAYNSGGLADLYFSGNYNFVEGIKYTPGATVNFNRFNITGNNSWAIRCNIAMTISGQVSNAINCFFSLASGGAITVAGTNQYNGHFHGCCFKRIGSSSVNYLVVHDQYGVNGNFTDCVFLGNGNASEDALFLDRCGDNKGSIIRHCRFYNWDDAILVDEEPNAATEGVVIVDNVFSTMAGYAVKRSNTEGGYVRLLRNYYHSCTSGFTNYSAEAEISGSTSLSGSPFTAAGSDDLSLNATAGAGAVCRAAGFPINHPYAWSTLADQATYAGSGGGLMRHPGMNGGISG